MKAPRWIDRATVDALHRLSLEQHGGQDGLRNEHGLESAMAQPQHVFTCGAGDLADMAAAYAYHLAQNQCFIDGNKRTAVLTSLYFLELNGVNTSPYSNAELSDTMIGIAEKRVSKAQLAAMFRAQIS